MIHRSLLLISLFLLMFGVTVSAQDDLIQIAQWAEDAEASSQYTDDSWSAERATGSPNVFACEDNADAWASFTYDGEESLTVYFDDEVIPTQLNIYQTLTPGAITAIELIPEDDDDDAVLFPVADQSDDCPSILSVNFPDDLPETIGVTIYMNQALVGYWNEIDAVELVGLVEGDEDDAQESSLEEADFEVDYRIFSVDLDMDDAETGGKGNADTTANTSGDYDVEWGRDVTCQGGGTIENGLEVSIIQQRAGNQYRVTAIGIGGFDPVLAVSLRGAYNNALCNDDSGDASSYSANLPTTGQVDSSPRSSQVVFDLNSAQTFEDVSIVVGGFGGSSGEFVLIVEGMFASSADGAGDPMALALSPALFESGVDPSAYMISVVGAFDPLIRVLDGDYQEILDNNGVPILCDDAGNERLCWGESSALTSSYVSRSQNRQLGGGQFDAMLTTPFSAEEVGLFVNYVMTSYGSTEGDYVVAFHLGIAGED
ncbi:MAG: hypothetical protein ACFE0Q_16315 [Anaerolineae bacterium]